MLLISLCLVCQATFIKIIVDLVLFHPCKSGRVIEPCSGNPRLQLTYVADTALVLQGVEIRCRFGGSYVRNLLVMLFGKGIQLLFLGCLVSVYGLGFSVGIGDCDALRHFRFCLFRIEFAVLSGY